MFVILHKHRNRGGDGGRWLSLSHHYFENLNKTITSNFFGLSRDKASHLLPHFKFPSDATILNIVLEDKDNDYELYSHNQRNSVEKTFTSTYNMYKL